MIFVPRQLERTFWQLTLLSGTYNASNFNVHGWEQYKIYKPGVSHFFLLNICNSFLFFFIEREDE